ncbi:MAG: hypothetical protein AVDCRST_MAG11-3089, partial [uncultured Gemmatimonadaceae bacterium]
ADAPDALHAGRRGAGARRGRLRPGGPPPRRRHAEPAPGGPPPRAAERVADRRERRRRPRMRVRRLRRRERAGGGRARRDVADGVALVVRPAQRAAHRRALLDVRVRRDRRVHAGQHRALHGRPGAPRARGVDRRAGREPTAADRDGGRARRLRHPPPRGGVLLRGDRHRARAHHHPAARLRGGAVHEGDRGRLGARGLEHPPARARRARAGAPRQREPRRGRRGRRARAGGVRAQRDVRHHGGAAQQPGLRAERRGHGGDRRAGVPQPHRAGAGRPARARHRRAAQRERQPQPALAPAEVHGAGRAHPARHRRRGAADPRRGARGERGGEHHQRAARTFGGGAPAAHGCRGGGLPGDRVRRAAPRALAAGQPVVRPAARHAPAGPRPGHDLPQGRQLWRPAVLAAPGRRAALQPQPPHV